jgi:hypothetical protein
MPSYSSFTIGTDAFRDDEHYEKLSRYPIVRVRSRINVAPNVFLILMLSVVCVCVADCDSKLMSNNVCNAISYRRIYSYDRDCLAQILRKMFRALPL